MYFECKKHPGCIWSCNCDCKNCKLYDDTFYITDPPQKKQKKNILLSDDKQNKILQNNYTDK